MQQIGNLLPNNRRQRRTCYASCHILYPVSAAHTSIFRMDSSSTSYLGPEEWECSRCVGEPAACFESLGLGLRVEGLGFRVKGLGLRV